MLHNTLHSILEFLFKEAAKMKTDGTGIMSASSSGDPISSTGRILLCLTSLNSYRYRWMEKIPY
jgi:hypothetical protein